MADEGEKLTVDGTLVRETERALLVDVNGLQVWLPKSQLTRVLKLPDNQIEVDIPAWLAEKKGL